MKTFLLRWIINTITLLVVTHVVPGIRVADWQVMIVAALVLGILNAFLRPILLIITLPINILSLGLFTFVINGFLFYLVSRIIKGFVVADFWSAFLGALLFSIVSFILNLTINSSGRVRVNYRRAAPPPPPPSERGNVIDADVVDPDEGKERRRLPQ